MTINNSPFLQSTPRNQVSPTRKSTSYQSFKQPPPGQNQSMESVQEMVPDERAQVRDFYYRSYGPKLGERYKDLYFLEKDLEQLKASGANQKVIDEKQRDINAKLQDIGRTNSAGVQKPKGNAPSKEFIALQNKAGFIYDYTTGKFSPNAYGGVVSGGFSTPNGPGYVQYDTGKPPTSQSTPSFVGSSSKGEDYFLYGKTGETVFKPKVSSQVLPVTTPASSLQSTIIYSVPKQENKIQQSIDGSTGLTREEERLNAFFQPRKEAIERLRNESFSLNVVGAGVKGLFGVSEAIVYTSVNPSKTFNKAILFGSGVLKNPVGETSRIAGEVFEEGKKDPIGFVVSNVVAGKAISTILKPVSRFTTTKLSKAQEKIGIGVFKEKPIEILPTSTKASSINELESIVGKEVELSHVTTKISTDNPITKIIKTAKGQESNIVNLTGPPTKTLSEYRQFIEQKSFYEFPTEKPGTIQGLGGFAGFFDKTKVIGSQPKTQFVLIKPTPTILTRTAKISDTPKFGPKINPTGLVTVPGGGSPITRLLTKSERKAIDILAKQESQPGKTFIAAENIAKISTERQVTTPVFVKSFPITGRPPSVGGALKLEKAGSTFARQKISPPAFIPEPIRGIIGQTDFFTETTRFNVIKTKLVNQSGDVLRTPKNNLKSFGESSNPVRIVSLGEKVKPGLYVSTISSSQTSNKVVSFSETVSTPSYSFVKNISSPINVSKSSSVSFNRPISSPGKFSSSSNSISIRFSSPPSPPSSTYSPPIPPSSPLISISNSPPSRISIPSFSSILSPPTTRPPFLSAHSKRKNRISQNRKLNRLEPGFFPVLFKSGKPVRRLSGVPLTKQGAIALGASFVESDIKASFKIVPSGGLAPVRGIRGPTYILREGKRDKTLFVEKNQYRISTPGEKEQLRLSRNNLNKKMKGRLF